MGAKVTLTFPGTAEQLEASGLLRGLTYEKEVLSSQTKEATTRSFLVLTVDTPLQARFVKETVASWNGADKLTIQIDSKNPKQLRLTGSGFDWKKLSAQIERFFASLTDAEGDDASINVRSTVQQVSTKAESEVLGTRITFDSESADFQKKFANRFLSQKPYYLFDPDRIPRNGDEIYLTPKEVADLKIGYSTGNLTGLDTFFQTPQGKKWINFFDSMPWIKAVQDSPSPTADDWSKAIDFASASIDPESSLFSGDKVYIWDGDDNLETPGNTFILRQTEYDAVSGQLNRALPKGWEADASHMVDTPDYGKVPLLHQTHPELGYYKYKVLLYDNRSGQVEFAEIISTTGVSNTTFDSFGDVVPGAFQNPDTGRYRPPTRKELEDYLQKNPGLFKGNPTLENLSNSSVRISRMSTREYFPVLVVPNPITLCSGVFFNPTNYKELDLPMTNEEIDHMVSIMGIRRTPGTAQDDAVCDDKERISAITKQGKRYLRIRYDRGRLESMIAQLETAIASGNGRVAFAGENLPKDFAMEFLKALRALQSEDISKWQALLRWMNAHPEEAALYTTLVISGATVFGLAVGHTLAHGLIPPLRRLRSWTTAKEQVEASMYKRAMDAKRSPGEVIALYTEDLVEKALGRKEKGGGVIQRAGRQILKRSDTEVIPPKDRLKPLKVEGDFKTALEEVFRTWLQVGKHSLVTVGDAGGGKSALQEAAAIEIAKKRVIEAFKAESKVAKNKDFWDADVMRTYHIGPEVELTSLCPKALMGKRLLHLKVEEFVAGTQWRGDLEDRVKDLMRALSIDPDTNTLLIEEIADNFQAGRSEGGEGVGKQLKPALATGKVGAWGNAVLADYRATIGKDKQAARRLPFHRLGATARAITDAIITAVARDQMERLKRLDPDFKVSGIELDFGEAAREIVMNKAAEFYSQAEPDRSIDLTKRLVTEMYMGWERGRRSGNGTALASNQWVVDAAYVEKYATDYLQHPAISDLRDKIEERLAELRREHFVRAEELGVREEVFTKGKEDWGVYKRRLERLLESLDGLKAKLDGGGSPFGGRGTVPTEEEVRGAIREVRDTFERAGRDLTDRPVDEPSSIAHKMAKVAELERELITSIIRFADESLIEPKEFGIPDAETFKKAMEKKEAESWDEYRARFERVTKAFNDRKEIFKRNGTDEATGRAKEVARVENAKMFGVYGGDIKDESIDGKTHEAIAKILIAQRDLKARLKPDGERTDNRLYRTWETIPTEDLQHTERAYSWDINARQVDSELPENTLIPEQGSRTEREYLEILEKEVLPVVERERDARGQGWEKAYEAEAKRLAEKAVKDGKASAAVIAYQKGESQEIPPSLKAEAKQNVDKWGEVLFWEIAAKNLRSVLPWPRHQLNQHFRELADRYREKTGQPLRYAYQLAEVVSPEVYEEIVRKIAEEGEPTKDKPAAVVAQIVARSFQAKQAEPEEEPETPPFKVGREEAKIKTLNPVDLERLFPKMQKPFTRREALALKNAFLVRANEAERVLFQRLYPGDSLPGSAFEIAWKIRVNLGEEQAARIFARVLPYLPNHLADPSSLGQALLRGVTADLREPVSPERERHIVQEGELRYRRLLEERSRRGAPLDAEETRRLEQWSEAHRRLRDRRRDRREKVPLPF